MQHQWHRVERFAGLARERRVLRNTRTLQASASKAYRSSDPILRGHGSDAATASVESRLLPACRAIAPVWRCGVLLHNAHHHGRASWAWRWHGHVVVTSPPKTTAIETRGR